MNDEIPEYIVQIPKKFNKMKNKRLRILYSSGQPIIQLLSMKQTRVMEINISSAEKIFFEFVFEYGRNCFKIILKEKTMTFYINDENEMKECCQRINRMLQLYHNKTEYEISESIYSTPSISNIYEEQTLMQPIKKTRSNTNVVMRKPNKPDDPENSEDTIPDRINSPMKKKRHTYSPHFYNYVFDKEYDVPKFKQEINPLKGRFDALETFPQINKSIKLDPVIFNAMKLREEILNVGGVQLEISSELIDGITLKEMDKKLWISGISNWQDLDNILHVGDRICVVNDEVVNEKFKFQQMFKKNSSYSLIIQRLPKAKVFVIDKSKVDISTISLENDKFIMIDSFQNKGNKWQITEVNGLDAFNIHDPNKIQNLQSMISSNLQYLSIIIHPNKFLKSLDSTSKKPLF